MREMSLLRCEVSEGIARITLNHPEKRNALSRAMLESLHEVLHWPIIQESRVIILASEGSVFSSGHDLRELENAPTETIEEIFRLCTSVMESIPKLGQPVIAEVQGLATAAGCQLVASCDLVVASEKARFGTPGVKIGLFCSTPAVPLCRTLPSRIALEMLFTGRELSAQEALNYGFVNRVVSAEELSSSAMGMARQIAQYSRSTIALGKRVYYSQLPLPRSDAYELATKAMVTNAEMTDAREGIGAFLQKRPPIWSS